MATHILGPRGNNERPEAGMDIEERPSQTIRERNTPRATWKPLSLHPALVSLMIAFTLFIIVILIMLQLKSNNDGGILFSNDVTNFPVGLNFLYLYLPTIIAVIYTTLWNWVDLNAKTLEPWYQLSKESGSLGKNSIMLQYPAEFLASVPIGSMRRRHWVVFCTSTILVVLFWAVTPVQSGIFAVKSVRKSQIQPVMASPGLLSPEEQSRALTMNFINQGYSVAWYGEKLPAFTTRTYALLPFLPAGDDLSGSNQTWTGNTILYDTYLDCRPPVSVTDDEDWLTFDDGQGCIAREIILSAEDYGRQNISAYYIGYDGDGGTGGGISLRGAGCNSSSLHTFLAVWSRTSTTPNFRNSSSFTALFCSTKYYHQSVEATVRLSDHSVQSFRSLAGKEELSEDTFNYTYFEQLIVTQNLPQKPATSIIAQEAITDRQELSDETAFQHQTLLDDSDILGSSVMIPFALGMTNSSTEELLQPSNLHHAFEAAHQLLFALAIQSVMRDPSNALGNISGIVESSFGAVVMVPLFTYLAIGFLSVVVILSLWMLYGNRNRALNLQAGPDSIASVISVAHQQEALKYFRDSDTDKIEKLTRPEDITFKLKMKGQGSQLMVATLAEVDEDCPLNSRNTNNTQPWPWELRPLGCCFLISVLTASIVAIIVINVLIERQNGLPMPSQSAIVQQIVLNLLPTALGTILEPFWTVLNRLLCILQPFFELSKGTAMASKSLLLEYTSVPPQLVFLRALRAKHWLLATVCAVTVSATVLTVGLSGLLETRIVNQQIPIRYNSLFSPKIEPPDSTSGPTGQYGQPLQIVLTNFSADISLPPWTTPKYYFIPYTIPEDGNHQDTSYTLTTMGIGSELDCQELKESGSDLLYRFTLNDFATEANFTVTERLPNGSTVRCFSPNGEIGDNATAPAETTQVYLLGSPEGKKGLELFMQPIPSYVSGTEEENYACPRMFVAGWVKSAISLGSKSSQTIYGPAREMTSSSVSSTFMMCKPRFQAANFSVTVDHEGYVLDYTRISPLTQDVDQLLGWSIWNATAFLVGAMPNPPTWHNDTVANDWFNLLLKSYYNSTTILDPRYPLPDFPTMANLVSSVYQELFAVTLQSNQKWLETSTTASVTGAKIAPASRIFFSSTMFKIVLVILLVDLAVAICVYARLPKPFLPTMPTSVAAILSFVSDSHLLQDFSKVETNGDRIDKYLEERGPVFGFGKYIGTDREIHVGIDSQPYLVPRHIRQSRLRRLTSHFEKQTSKGSDLI
ncbi:hypothetical protein DTO021D3_2153 [Paecilomyces variotii]|nr:hypothetical protein DTO032I3_1740 [Paecilomyces variotii]KAJ9281099.1 hypothetical protein DTO021D3_2153 [Paecilomyces variotii]KAJ9345472.1 hypothetical protein DTO027B6_2003 [Paecilomyces variotii]KAJ9386041.1 hypothetical protein DTO032I4_3772 [Paecilomyces variotii]